MEVGDGLEERFPGEIGQHLLELAKCHAGTVSQLRIYFVVTFAISDEQHHPPVITVCVAGIECSVKCGNKRQHPPVDIGDTLLLQLPADVSGYAGKILLQLIYIPEDMMVDALQYILFAGGLHFEGVVDMPFSSGLIRTFSSSPIN